MNIKNYSHTLKNYLVGVIAVLLVVFIPTLDLLDRSYSIDPLKMNRGNNRNPDKSASPESPTEDPVNSKAETSSQPETGLEPTSILNKPPPEGAVLPRKICMVTTVSLKADGIFSSIFSNIESESCDVESFKLMSIASAGAQISPSTRSYRTSKTGPYFSTATKDLTVSDNSFTFIGSQRFVETITVRIGWLDILRNPGFLLGSSVIRKAQYFPLETQADMNLFWSPGEPAYFLENPKGETFIMTHYSVKLLPGLNRYNLLSLKKLLILPPQWKFAKAEIDKPIWITHGGGEGFTQVITYDNLGNIYVKANLKDTVDLKNMTE